LKKKIKKFKIKTYRLMLCQIKKLSKISLLEIYPGAGALYCRSPGSFGKIIKFDSSLKNTLITLPSGIKKLFSFYSFAFTAKIAPSSSSKMTSTKSGY
jgi:ribosomal protein L2